MKAKEKPLFLDSITGEISDTPQEPVLINARHLQHCLLTKYDANGWDYTAEHINIADINVLVGNLPKYSQQAGAVHINYDKAIKKAYKQIVKETREGNRNRCPFCGSEDVRPRYAASGWYTECGRCRATGPVAASKDDAKRTWRKRIWQKKKH